MAVTSGVVSSSKNGNDERKTLNFKLNTVIKVVLIVKLLSSLEKDDVMIISINREYYDHLH